jgi:predicted ATP-dependent endonuclease of OLD family
MLLKRLIVEKLYGYLNFDINFNDDVSILIGINGCGKTSALNVVEWLLRGKFRKLASEQYSRLHLDIDFGGDVYSLVSEKNSETMEFSVFSTAFANPLPPITVRLMHPDDLRGNLEDGSREHYRDLRLESHEIPMWQFLQSLPSLTVISLDRQLSAEADDIFYLEDPKLNLSSIPKKKTPISHVQDLMIGLYTEYRAKATQYDNELKNRILMTAFQDPMLAFGSSHVRPMKDEDIVRLENKVVKYLSTSIMADEVTKHVRQFFKSSRSLARQLTHEGTDQNFAMGFMLLRYRQIEALAKAFNDLEVKNTAAFSELKNYLDALNKFFKDSGKKLYFDEITNSLAFRSLEKNEINTSHFAGGNILKLSSGEQQILILFTFLSFVAKPSTVFIVDEPELSLHPKWQYDFMKAFLALRPKSTQILLATHSPEIVGRFKQACVLL